MQHWKKKGELALVGVLLALSCCIDVSQVVCSQATPLYTARPHCVSSEKIDSVTLPEWLVVGFVQCTLISTACERVCRPITGSR